jgi:hypothetical protein
MTGGRTCNLKGECIKKGECKCHHGWEGIRCNVVAKVFVDTKGTEWCMGQVELRSQGACEKEGSCDVAGEEANESEENCVKSLNSVGRPGVWTPDNKWLLDSPQNEFHKALDNANQKRVKRLLSYTNLLHLDMNLCHNRPDEEKDEKSGEKEKKGNKKGSLSSLIEMAVGGGKPPGPCPSGMTRPLDLAKSSIKSKTGSNQKIVNMLMKNGAVMASPETTVPVMWLSVFETNNQTIDEDPESMTDGMGRHGYIVFNPQVPRSDNPPAPPPAPEGQDPIPYDGKAPAM